MSEDIFCEHKNKKIKKITPQRLKNIALHYLKRFDSSVANLRSVLQRRVNDFAYYNPEFDKDTAFAWIENIIADFERCGYLDDERYAEIKVRSYLNSGKSSKYIKLKLRQKGVDRDLVDDILDDSDYNALDTALALAKKKKIGPYRSEPLRKDMRKKDMATLVRAGFDYDTICQVLDYNICN